MEPCQQLQEHTILLLSTHDRRSEGMLTMAQIQYIKHLRDKKNQSIG
ncbi:MAG: hypothetical protein DDT28_00883 [Dehalococcoidia bacterium]|nr:hypothetical protein [Chloroflexota bacterium]